MTSIKWLLLLGTAAAAACTSDSAAGPPAPPCNATLATDLALAVGAYTAIDPAADSGCVSFPARSEEHTSELQSLAYLVCRLLLEKKKKLKLLCGLVAGVRP